MKIRQIIALVLLLLPTMPLLAQTASSFQLHVAKAQIDPTFDSLFVPQKRGWLGADGAASVPLDSQRVLWVFGDTLLGNQRQGKREGPMVNNTIAIHTLAPGGGPGSVTYHWDFTDRLPGSFFHPDKFDAPYWYWPGTGFMHDGTLYLLLTRVDRGEGPGGFSFRTIGCTLFKIANPSEPPEQWRPAAVDLGVGDDHFNINAAALVEGGVVYLLGYHDPDDSPTSRVAILSRLPLAALNSPEPAQALEYWSRDGQWRPTRDALAPLFAPGQTETSLHYDPVRRRYISVVIRPFKSDLCLVSAEALTGPWTEPQKVFDIPDLQINEQVHAYAGRAHPELAPSPHDIIITYVSNTTDFWSMFSMMEIYYPRFVRITLEPPAPAGENRP